MIKKQKVMKTIQKKYELIRNEVAFLTEMEFDAEDTAEVIECKERDPHHTLLLYVADDGKTISVTPSDADVHFFILRDEDDDSVIGEVMDAIQKFIDNGDLVEI